MYFNTSVEMNFSLQEQHHSYVYAVADLIKIRGFHELFDFDALAER